MGSRSHKRKRPEEAPVLTSCDWVRGRLLGHGGFGTVFLGSLKKKPKLEETFPSTMAVKSAVISRDIELRRERFYLDLFSDCPFVIDCYGDDNSSVDSCGNMLYDVFLEYANGGSLADLIQKSGKFGLPETLVRKYTQQILRGLKFIHEKRCVHCDLKPENILLVGDGSNSNSGCDFVAKIADLGLTKKAMQRMSRSGTPKYMAPETAGFEVQEQYSDIWALGCIVVKMLTGRHLWNVKPGIKRNDLFNIIASYEPHIPTGLSKDATDFLVNCLHRFPGDRLTASELLKHPFILQHCQCELCECDREVEVEALKLKQEASQAKVHCEEEEVGCPDFIPLGSCSGQADADVEEEALNLITESAPAVIPNSTPPVRPPIDSRPAVLPNSTPPVRPPIDSRPPVRAWDIVCGG